MLLLKIFLSIFPRFFFFLFMFPSEIFTQKLLTMWNVLMHGRWKLICFWICFVKFCFVAWKHLEKFFFFLFLKSLYFFFFCTNNQIPHRIGAVVGAEKRHKMMKIMKFLMMRIKTCFIDFKWWWKSLKMSKYWRFASQNGWTVISHHFSNFHAENLYSIN